MEEKVKQEKGFRRMDPEIARQIRSKGGKACHASGARHKFTSEEAREAGRKGGLIISQNRAHMSEMGKKGGAVSGRMRRKENV